MSKEKHTSDGGSTDYYNFPEGMKEIQDLVEYRNMNFALGNIFKAVWRIGHKEGIDDLYDLNKIIFFANREINRIKKKDEYPVFEVEFKYDFDKSIRKSLEEWDKAINECVVSFENNKPKLEFNKWQTWRIGDIYPWEYYSNVTRNSKVNIQYANGKTSSGRFKDFTWGDKKNYNYIITKYMLPIEL